MAVSELRRYIYVRTRALQCRVVRVRAQAGVIVLCSEPRRFTLTVLLLTQVYKWVSANVLGVTLRWTSIPSRGGVAILLAASC